MPKRKSPTLYLVGGTALIALTPLAILYIFVAPEDEALFKISAGVLGFLTLLLGSYLVTMGLLIKNQNAALRQLSQRAVRQGDNSAKRSGFHEL